MIVWLLLPSPAGALGVVDEDTLSISILSHRCIGHILRSHVVWVINDHFLTIAVRGNIGFHQSELVFGVADVHGFRRNHLGGAPASFMDGKQPQDWTTSIPPPKKSPASSLGINLEHTHDSQSARSKPTTGDERTQGQIVAKSRNRITKSKQISVWKK